MFLTYSRIFFGPLFLFSVFLNVFMFSDNFCFVQSQIFLMAILQENIIMESQLGKLLDPIADKILLCSSLIAIILITNDYFIGLHRNVNLIERVLGIWT